MHFAARSRPSPLPLRPQCLKKCAVAMKRAFALVMGVTCLLGALLQGTERREGRLVQPLAARALALADTPHTT